MKCANCGNDDQKTFFDEGDTYYCSKCHHRTRTKDGKDDLIKCKVCGRLKDRKAMNCWWCNSSEGDEKNFDENDLKIMRKNANDFAKSEDSNNIIYKKIRGENIYEKTNDFTQSKRRYKGNE